MKLTLSKLLAAGTLLCFAGACAKVNESSESKSSGQLHVTTQTAVATAGSGSGAEPICATFTLTPYAPTSGTTIAQAGTPVTFTTSSTSTATQQILGCIDGTTGYNFPNGSGGSTSANWGYLVSATNFVYCDPAVQAATPLDPTTVDPAPAYYAAVNCVAGQDEDLVIDYPISISSADNGGYIDISAGVTATDQYTGCKQAEIDSTGTLYFGESNTIDGTGSSPAPLGLIGFTTSDTTSDAYLQQFGGQVYGADPANPSSTLYDTYYTGQFAATSSAAPKLPSAILQTFLTDATEANLFDGGTASCPEWVDSRHAICTTTVSGTTANTTGSLADAFLFVPGTGYAAASVTDPTDITIYSQFANNSGNDYTSLYSVIETANASPGFSSNDNAPANISANAGFNDGLTGAGTTVTPPTSLPGLKFTGVYIDPAHIGQFLVTLTDGSANDWASLSQSGGTWSVGTPADISSAPAGVGQEAAGCINLPQPSAACPCWDPATISADIATLTAGGPSTYTALDGTTNYGSAADPDVDTTLQISPTAGGYVGLDVFDNNGVDGCDAYLSGVNTSVSVNDISPAQLTSCLSDLATFTNDQCQTNNGAGDCPASSPICIYAGPGQEQCIQCNTNAQCAGNANGSVCDLQTEPYVYPADPPTLLSQELNTCVECAYPGFACASGTYCNNAGACVPPAAGSWVEGTAKSGPYGSTVWSINGQVISSFSDLETACAGLGGRVPTVEELQSALTAQFVAGTVFPITFQTDTWYVSDNGDNSNASVVVSTGSSTNVYNGAFGNSTPPVCIIP